MDLDPTIPQRRSQVLPASRMISRWSGANGTIGSLIGLNQGPIPTAEAAFRNHHALVKEALQSPFALDALTLPDEKATIPALANRLLPT